MHRSTGLAALGLAALVMTNEAHAGGFTPWGTATGDGTVALSPYFFVQPDGTFQASPYVWFGATDHFDVLAGVTFTLGTDANGLTVGNLGAIELMPRGIINDYAIFGAHLFYDPVDLDANYDLVANETVTIGLEYHGVAATDSFFVFTYNAFWWADVGAGIDGLDNNVLGFILVPEFIISDRFSAFVEVNPSVTFVDDANGDDTMDAEYGVSVVPGVTVYVDNEGNHSLTPAAIFGIAGVDTTVTFGLLYFGMFDASAKSAKRKLRDNVGTQLASF